MPDVRLATKLSFFPKFNKRDFLVKKPRRNCTLMCCSTAAEFPALFDYLEEKKNEL